MTPKQYENMIFQDDENQPREVVLKDLNGPFQFKDDEEEGEEYKANQFQNKIMKVETAYFDFPKKE